jgi:large repetitive protein
MGRKSLFVCLSLAVGGLLHAQPQITSLQSSPFYGSDSVFGAAITGGTDLPEGFILYVNGSFNPNNFSKVTWTNTITGQTQDFFVEGGVQSTGTTQIVVQIPQTLFPAVSGAQAVNITVTEVTFLDTGTITNVSNASVFTINPLMAAPNLLPAGTVGTPYSASLFTGGTPPYSISLSEGSNPPPTGLSLPASPTNTPLLTGTPGAPPGLGNFSITVTDEWGNVIFPYETIEIVATPTVSQVSPNTTIAGTNGIAITVTGTNFVTPTTLDLLTNYPGSVIRLTIAGANSFIVALPTTVVNSTTAQATIPAQYLSSAGVIGVSVVQPSAAVSNSLPFTVTGPAITQVSPSPITARPTAIPVTVTGSGFLASGAGSPVQSTILLNGTPVATTFNSTGSLSTNAIFATPNTTASFQAMNPGGSLSNTVVVNILAAPSISSATPNPFPGGGLTVNGLNFTNTMTVLFNGTPLSTAFVSATRLTAVAPPALFASSGNSALISVRTTDNFTTAAVSIALSTVQITTASLPQATGLQPYSAKLAATGGTSPYLWSASGLPSGLSVNAQTGDITGTPTTFGAFQVLVTATDSFGAAATARLTLNVSAPAPPPQITTGGTLPVGFVQVSYNTTVTASGGNGALSFAQGTGNLPPGLTLDSNGVLRGLPTTVGTYTFSVVVTDADNLSGSGTFTLVIKPQPLAIITSSPLASVAVGSSVNVKFTAFGGVLPYSFSGSNLPPGLSMAADGTLSGTATAAGTFPFTVTVSDNAGDTPSTKNFSLTVTGTALSVTGTLVDGQVGVPYSASIGATGGSSPYVFSTTGLPDGLLFGNGTVAGTPTVAGKFTVTVNVTDSKNANASQTFTINIAPGALTITTATLPNGTVGVAYSASLAASGGTGALSWSVSGLPGGVSATAAGAISGTPTASGNFTVSATVTDGKGATATKSYTVTVSAATLAITTASLANATAGTAYSANVAASGGVEPYQFSATGLPAGLSMSASGAIAGTTTATGAASVTVTVKDAAGTTVSKTYTLTVGLPAAPALTVTGLPATSAPATQSTVQIGIGAAYPVPVTVNLSMTFAADSGPDDPTVQFSTGGRTAQLTIPAGATAALTTVGVQSGTVAGTATITARLVAGTQDITPSPAPTRTVRINSIPPVATTVTATGTSTGFTVTVTGFATARRITQAIFTFTPAAGVNLQTTTVTINVDAVFSAWYSSSAAAAFGSQFIYTQPFTVNGGAGSVASVSVTLVNADGSSTPVTAVVK